MHHSSCFRTRSAHTRPTTESSSLQHLRGHSWHCSYTRQSIICLIIWPHQSSHVHFSQPRHPPTIPGRWRKTEAQWLHLAACSLRYSYQWFCDSLQSELGYTAPLDTRPTQIELYFDVVWSAPSTRLTIEYSHAFVGNLHYIPVAMDARSSTLFDTKIDPPRLYPRTVRIRE